jgi:ribosomal-protein-alanine N-acetyltransferase
VTVRLRPLTSDDVPEVAALERELFGRSAWTPSMLREELGAPGRTYLAAELDELDEPAGAPLAGYAGSWWDGDVVQVMTIGVREALQGRGVGRALLGAILAQAVDLGAGAVLLEVRVDNARAIELYERAGFVVLARRRRYYQPEDVDAWTMRLDLSARDA